MVPVLLVSALALFAMGVPLALVGFRFRARIAGFNRRAVATSGQVVANKERRITSGSFNRTVHFPEIAFTDQQGREHRATDGGSREPLAIGTPVSLLYDPKDPAEVSFRGPRGQSGIATMMAAMGGFLALGGAAALAGAAVVLVLGA